MVYGLAKAPELDDESLDAVFGALAHSARRSVLQYLAENPGPAPMNAIAAATDVSPQLLNKHAATLERAGLITREPSGREKHVRVHPDVLAQAREWIEHMTAYWNAQLDSLEEYVATLSGSDHPPAQQES